MILFINACVRKESRTKRLADHVIASLSDKDIKEIRLWEMSLPKVDESFIIKRTDFCKDGNYSDPIFDLGKDFAAADTIVIAAPYYDLSFPSMLKQYLEQICVTGLTFYYNEQNIPEGLCKAQKLFYITTAGGPIINDDYGYGYVRELAKSFFSIPETVQVKAEMLDVIGFDAEAILAETIRKFDNQ